MIRNEIGISKIVQHPNIVCFHSVMQSAKRVFLISELIVGKDLNQYIMEKKKLSEYQAANITYYLLCAIQYMHDTGIVHRDLKPENIMIQLTQDEQEIQNVKIIDFGLSITLLPGKLVLEQCGTLVYIAPEVFLKYGYSKEVDLWSIGIILYCMLIGTLPYKQSIKFIIEDKVYKDITYEGILSD